MILLNGMPTKTITIIIIILPSHFIHHLFIDWIKIKTKFDMEVVSVFTFLFKKTSGSPERGYCETLEIVLESF